MDSVLKTPSFKEVLNNFSFYGLLNALLERVVTFYFHLFLFPQNPHQINESRQCLSLQQPDPKPPRISSRRTPIVPWKNIML